MINKPLYAYNVILHDELLSVTIQTYELCEAKLLTLRLYSRRVRANIVEPWRKIMMYTSN